MKQVRTIVLLFFCATWLVGCQLMLNVAPQPEQMLGSRYLTLPASLPTLPDMAPPALPAPNVADAGLSVEPAAPIRLRIPAIGVDAAIESVGLTEDGQMGIPAATENVAWFDVGSVPGALGNAVISGHLDDPAGPAVFWRLADLQPGDEIIVVDVNEREQTFVVTDSEAYPAQQAPLTKIFGVDFERDLNLITCDGQWNPATRQYNQRLVVYTRLVVPGANKRIISIGAYSTTAVSPIRSGR